MTTRALNLLSGRISGLRFVQPSGDELELFRTDFADLLTTLSRLDPELSQSFEDHRGLYEYALGVAKAFFDEKPFGGLRPSTGQFGFRLLKPQDIGVVDLTNNTSTVHSWVRSISLAANVNYADLIGGAGAPVRPITTQDNRTLHVFHALVSWRPATRVRELEWTVNRYTYPPYTVEPWAKVEKPFKTFRVFPVPGAGVVVHPGGEYYVRAQFEKDDFAAAETHVEEIALLGVLFGEYDYLAREIQ